MAAAVLLPTGSTKGAPIKIGATDFAAPGTVLTLCSNDYPQEVYVWVCNNYDAIVDFLLQTYDGNTLIAEKYVAVQPRKGDFLVHPGVRLE